MLFNLEKQNIAAILESGDDSGNSLLIDVIHQLLDNHRIEDIPDAVETYLSSAEIFVGRKRAYVHANFIVGPIVNRYMLPAIGAALSLPVQVFAEWSLNPENRLTDRLREGIKSGAILKSVADEIVAEVQRYASLPYVSQS